MKNISLILFAIFGCLLVQTDAAVIKASTVAPGYNSNDATACFVNAIDTAAKPGDTVVFDNVGTGVWRIKGRYPSFFDCNKNTPNNITVIVEPGVTIFGIDGTYTGSHRLNMLWRWENCDRIKIVGYGATLKMNKNACCESGGESMHNLAFYDCSNIHIEGLYIDGSGGDGVYFGTRTETGLCRNIVVKNIVATNHRRQGMTITSLENGHIEDCAFLSTSGAPPNAGIDFEPNHPTNRLINIRVNNCFFNKNHYNGLAFHMSKMLSSPHAISVTLHDTFVVDNWRETPGREDQGYVKAELATGGGPAKGLIEFNRVMFADSRYGGIRNYKHHDRYKLVFNDAVFEGLGRQGGVEKPIELHRYNYRDTPGRPSMGNMEFNGLFVREDRNIPFMEINSADGAPLEDFVVKDCLVVSPNTVGILDTDGVRKNPPASQKISFSLEKTMPSQTVTLVATRATAVRGGEAGSVTVTRTGAKNFPLAVRYTVGGPAKNFDDFDALHGFVIIPTNEASAVISVKARAQSASSTHVTLTLKAHEDYTVGAQNVARVDIGATGVTAAPTTTPEPATTADPNDKQAPSIVSFKVVDITSTSFRVNFTMSEPSSAGIEFGETTAYGTVGPSEKTFRYQTHVQTVKDLKPATTYHWRIFNVSDVAGNKAAPGPDQTTTTLGDGETTAPTTTSVSQPTTTATKATPAQQTSTSATTTAGTATVNLYGCIKGANGCECDAAGNCIADTLECSQLSSTVQRCVEVGCEERGSCHSCTKGKLGCECRDGDACDSELTCAKVSDTRSICVEPLVVSATSSIVLSFGVAVTVFVSLLN